MQLRHRLAGITLGLVLAGAELPAVPAGKHEKPVFTHGVASGDVTPTSAILWTRVDRDTKLKLEVWKNPALIGPRAFEKTIPHASAAHDFTVKVDATGLAPATTYYFRFRQGHGGKDDAAKSDVGSFRTAPDPSTPADIRATYSGDADGTRLQNGAPAFNEFEVLDAARQEGGDFFVFNGDTIYADSSFRTTGPATTLAEYHAAHRENRGYASLRSLLAATSVYATMDDHEIVNNYNAQTVDPARFAAGRQAFLDYYPIREEGLLQDPACAGAPLYRKFRWGSEVEVFVLDERSCRSADAAAVCQGDLAPTVPGPVRTMPPFNAFVPPAPPAGCLETIYSPARTLLGPVQLAQLRADLGSSTAKWKLVVSEEPIQQFHVLPYDRWEGYANERNALLTFIRDNAVTGVKFLSTDLHATLVNQVAIERFLAPGRVADEFVTGPIAAPTQQAEVLAFGGPGALAAYNGLLSLNGVDCRNLNKNSYAVVEVGAMAGTIALTSKDQNGAPVKDALTATNCSALDSRPTPDYELVDGQVGGALYRLVRPANWNGELLVYAHGYVFPDAPVALPAEANVLVGLLAPQGFALAYSSFSENGWAIQDGAERTHQLIGVFKSKFGKPTRVYVAGASMGGLIAIKLAETHPNTYAGALPACAVAGGTRGLFEYHSHARALFDFFYPGVLPGNAVEVPPGTDVTEDIVLPAFAAMTADPTPVSYLAAIDQTPFPFATPDELVQSIVTALGAHVDDLQDVLLTKGKAYFDNQETIYSSALLPAPLLQAINAGVGRFGGASPSALKGFERNYQPSGELRAPMLMLSNARDPVVPGFNQMSYGAAAAAAGTADLLVQRQVPAYGHCVFTPAELGTAFSDLVKWVELGIKPLP